MNHLLLLWHSGSPESHCTRTWPQHTSHHNYTQNNVYRTDTCNSTNYNFIKQNSAFNSHTVSYWLSPSSSYDYLLHYILCNKNPHTSGLPQVDLNSYLSQKSFKNWLHSSSLSAIWNSTLTYRKKSMIEMRMKKPEEKGEHGERNILLQKEHTVWLVPSHSGTVPAAAWQR